MGDGPLFSDDRHDSFCINAGHSSLWVYLVCFKQDMLAGLLCSLIWDDGLAVFKVLTLVYVKVESSGAATLGPLVLNMARYS
jgi:hypothetical protein